MLDSFPGRLKSSSFNKSDIEASKSSLFSLSVNTSRPDVALKTLTNVSSNSFCSRLVTLR